MANPTVPGAPTGVTATAGNARATVSWTPPTDDGGSAIIVYTVTASPGNATASVTAPSTSVAVTGLTNGSSYTFTVVATNAVGTSVPSAPSAAAIPVTVPSPPLSVLATGGNQQAGVSWVAPTDAGGSPIATYTVTASPGGASLTVPVATTSATFTGLSNGTSYSFTVVATNGVGTSAPSGASNAVLARTVPDSPTTVTAVPDSHQATVSWTAPNDQGSPITGYTVTSSPGGLTASVSGGTTTGTVTGLTNGVSYTFTVVATNAVGPSAVSTPSSAVIPAAVPDAPRNVVLAMRNGTATVTWDLPLDDGGVAITGYTVTAAPGGLHLTTPPPSPPATGGTATLGGFTQGVTYTVTMVATNSMGDSLPSAGSNAVTSAAIPDAPFGVTALAADGAARVSWSRPRHSGGAHITQYTVTTLPGGTTQVVSGAITSARITGLTNGSTYRFTVFATNSEGDSAPTAPSNAVTPVAACTGRLPIARLPAVPTGTSSDGAELADFNADGKLDLAVVNQSANQVSVALSNGDGTFQPRASYPVGSAPQATASGDFNGDGKADLAVPNKSSNTVSVLIAGSGGVFAAAVSYSTDTKPDSVAVADANGDGKPDLFVACQGAATGSVQILLNNGDGTFAAAVGYPAGTSPSGVAVGDFNGDGKVDAVVRHVNSTDVSILLANTNGTLQAAQSWTLSAIPGFFTASDFNHDGNLDLATTYQSGSAVVMLGKGDGTFDPESSYPVGPVGTTDNLVKSKDVDGDGYADLVVLDTQATTLSVLLNHHDGTFIAGQVLSTGVALGGGGLAIGDLNSDGRPELVETSGISGSTALIVEGNGDGTFVWSQSATAPASRAVASADFDGDGRLDLAVADSGLDTVSVLKGNPDGTFQPAVHLSVGTNPLSLAVGDFNNDGNQDVVAADYVGVQVATLLGNGDGTFRPVVLSIGTDFPNSMVSADLNNDGVLDLAIADPFHGMVVLLGVGDGSFQAPVVKTSGTYPWDLGAGDFDGDGDVDLAVSNYGSNDLTVYLNPGNGAFPTVAPAAGLPLNSAPQHLTTGDLNGDGVIDLVVQSGGGGPGDNGFDVLLGNGTGGFLPFVHHLSGLTDVGGVTAADLDGDGFLDVVGSGSGDRLISIALGDGNGGFGPAVRFPAGANPLGMTVADFNGDGSPDLAVAGDKAVNVILRTGCH